MAKASRKTKSGLKEQRAMVPKNTTAMEWTEKPSEKETVKERSSDEMMGPPGGRTGGRSRQNAEARGGAPAGTGLRALDRVRRQQPVNLQREGRTVQTQEVRRFVSLGSHSKAGRRLL